jgi:hypothetical protein
MDYLLLPSHRDLVQVNESWSSETLSSPLSPWPLSLWPDSDYETEESKMDEENSGESGAFLFPNSEYGYTDPEGQQQVQSFPDTVGSQGGESIIDSYEQVLGLDGFREPNTVGSQVNIYSNVEQGPRSDELWEPNTVGSQGDGGGALTLLSRKRKSMEGLDGEKSLKKEKLPPALMKLTSCAPHIKATALLGISPKEVRICSSTTPSLSFLCSPNFLENCTSLGQVFILCKSHSWNPYQQPSIRRVYISHGADAFRSHEGWEPFERWPLSRHLALFELHSQATLHKANPIEDLSGHRETLRRTSTTRSLSYRRTYHQHW